MDFCILGWRFVLRSLEDLVGWYQIARILVGSFIACSGIEFSFWLGFFVVVVNLTQNKFILECWNWEGRARSCISIVINECHLKMTLKMCSCIGALLEVLMVVVGVRRLMQRWQQVWLWRSFGRSSLSEPWIQLDWSLLWLVFFYWIFVSFLRQRCLSACTLTHL